MPVLTDLRTVQNLSIHAGASLTLNAGTSRLVVLGSFQNSGTFIHTGGRVLFDGASAQTAPAVSFNELEIGNASGVSLSGATAVNDSLKLTGGFITLGNYTLTSAGNISGFDSSHFVVTNGSGSLKRLNIGTGGKTGNIIFPVGSTSSSYNPVVLNNTGTADDFAVRALDSITSQYSGNTAIGLRLTSNVVNKTWFVSESVAGGSNATISFQWSAADELTGFDRTNCYISTYSGSAWGSVTGADTAAGSGPYMRTISGVTAFAPFGLGSGGALPVKLIRFTAERSGTSIDLNWITATEIQNDHFIVERSYDQVAFERIASVHGKGNSNTNTVYDFTDRDVDMTRGATIYYRLTQVDIDGNTSKPYYAVALIAQHPVATQLSAQPNPFSSRLSVVMNSTSAGEGVLRITDMNGKVCLEKPVKVEKGSQVFEIDAADSLANGMYFISLQGTDLGTTYQKIIRQN
jgi:hypothetical protein